MNKDLVLEISSLLEKNLIPYMEVSKSSLSNIDITIKVYFPKIVLNICKFLHKKYTLENKDELVIRKDKDAYHFVDVTFYLEKQKVTIRIHSMLQNTWGIARNL